jgi:hypothetical protein
LRQRKKQILSRRRQVESVNRRSQVFISNRFLKFHLFQNLIFYFVLFTVPSVSIIDCQRGFSFVSYATLASFMGLVGIFDLINMNQYTNKERLKLNLKQVVGESGKKKYVWDLIVIYVQAIYEMYLTQLNIFDLYTDFCFLTVVYTQPTLRPLFMLSVTSFALSLLPRLVSWILIIRILCDD